MMSCNGQLMVARSVIFHILIIINVQNGWNRIYLKQKYCDNVNEFKASLLKVLIS